ncbi:HET-domain-containing protein [Xylariaceae sp. FL1019]|nr:HET-domain-containing protein [Xylariaceae sp. FL1019]
MWLINARTRLLEEFIGSEIPQYAILSHIWEAGQEVSFREITSELRSGQKRGHWKIDQTCQEALRDGLEYAWIDTCCIDKSSSAELSEAINSMFRWYQCASVCYVYFADLKHPVSDALATRCCRWFNRAWTLQELIAPRHIKFYAHDWRFCFSKEWESHNLSAITGINELVLNHKTPLSFVCVAQKMSWARWRQATRIEDIAYSLLGIFDINMPLLYGEGDKAFMRLQSEIIRSCPDLSILAWAEKQDGLTTDTKVTDNMFSTVLASSPNYFGGCHDFSTLPYRPIHEFSFSNRGISLRAKFDLQVIDSKPIITLPVCQTWTGVLAIKVRNIGGGLYVRQDPCNLAKTGFWEMENRIMLNPILLTQLSPNRPQGKRYGWDTIRSLRHCGLQVVLDSTWDISCRWPWTHWDEVDRLFFGPRYPELGWAILKVKTDLPAEFVTEEGGSSLTVMLYVFGWAKRSSQPRGIILRIEDAASERALDDMNNTAVAKDWNASWILNQLAKNDVSEHATILIGTSLTKGKLLLMCEFVMVRDFNVCPNYFWRVSLTWKTVPKTQELHMEDR